MEKVNMSVNELDVNGVKYIRKDSLPVLVPNGKRAVIVVDRGWIFAGDVEEKDGRIILTRAVWVFRWSTIGFDVMLKKPKAKEVELRLMDHAVDLPSDAEIFRIPVDNNWGL